MIGSIRTASGGMALFGAQFEKSASRVAGVEKDPAVQEPVQPTPIENPVEEVPNSYGYLAEVDLPREMTNMTVAQKAYEANANVIKTASEMLDKALDIKA